MNLHELFHKLLNLMETRGANPGYNIDIIIRGTNPRHETAYQILDIDCYKEEKRIILYIDD